MARAPSNRDPDEVPDEAPDPDSAPDPAPPRRQDPVPVVPDPNDASPRGRFNRGEIGWAELQLALRDEA